MLKKWLLVPFLFQVGLLSSTTASWTGTTSTNWNTPGNWSPATVPNNVGDIANIDSTTTPNFAITIANDTITLGQLNIDSSLNYTLSNGSGHFVLDVTSGSAAITIANSNGNGTHTIAAPLTLSDALTITQGSTANFEISGVITGSLGMTKEGNGVLVLSGNNAASYTGQLSINTGTVSIAADSNLGAAGTALTMSNGILLYTGTDSPTRAISITGNAQIQAETGVTATLNGVISGSGNLTTADDGTVVLAASNTYTGGTTVSGGTLSISSDANLGNTSGGLHLGNGTLLLTSGISSARSGSITGNATIDSAASNTFSGNFNGAGSLTLQSGGTFTLTGSNSYSGGTTVATGTTLAGTTNGIQGAITLNAASSNLIFNQNFNGTYSSAITSAVASAGALTKTGTGTLTITGTSSSFSGTTVVNQGTLVVNESLGTSAVTVASGATLGGSGTVGATASSGTIYPGISGSSSTLTINGTLTLNPTSAVNILIAPLTADKLAVSGAANTDGSLNIKTTPAFYGFSQNYTILTSSALTDGFDAPTSDNSNFVPSVSSTATSLILNIIILRPLAVFPFSNENTRAVGNNIDDVYASGQLSQDLTNVFTSLVGQNNDTINAALDEMHPAQYSAFTEMQSEVGGQLLSLFHRLPYFACSCRNPNRLWIEPFGNSLHMKQKGLELGFQANTGGLAFGYDGQITDNFVLGIGGAWSNSHLDWQEHRGSGEVNGLYGGVYFDSLTGQFYFGGSLLAGLDFYETTRHIQFVYTDRKAEADYRALDVMAQIASAYLFGSPQAFFYPYANFDFLYLQTKKFTETGANGLDLNVYERSDGTLRTEMGLGLQVQDRNAAGTMCVSPLVSIGWVNLCPLIRPKWKATFQGASIPFEVRGWDETWNLLNVNFGLSINYLCYSLKLQYNAEISPDSDTTLYNQHGNVRLDWKW